MFKQIKKQAFSPLHPSISKAYTAFILLTFLFTSVAQAQNGNIKGRILNAKTNEAIEAAIVSIQGTKISTTTDNNGNYSFSNITPGFKRLIVQSIGFETTVSSEIQIQGNQSTFLDISVNPNAVSLKEVVVRQTRTNLKKIDSPVSALSLGVQEIEKTAGANRDVSKVVQTLPGVAATDPNRNDLIVRGGGPSENAFYLDGMEIPVINHFATQGSSGGAVGVINPDFVSEINFYTGAFPANRGNALSSVMDIRQKDGSKDRLHTKLSVGASDAALTLDGPIGQKSTFIVSARQSYLQFLFSALGLPFLPTYNDFQVKYKYRIDKKNEISLLGIGAIDNMKLNTDIQNPTESQRYILSYLPTYKQWNYAIGAVYKHYAETHFDTWVMSRNMLRNSNYKYLNNDEKLGKTSDYKSDEAENKLRFERSYPDLPVNLLFGAGLKYASYSNHTQRMEYENNSVQALEYDTKLNLFGYNAFAQASKKVLDERLSISVGLNITGNNYNDNMANPLNQFSPRLSLSYSLTDKLDLNANVGRYSLQPAYTTLGYRNAAGELVNQNENLRYTISNQAIAGIEFRPADKMRFTVEGFYKHYTHYPVSVKDGISIASKGTNYGQVGDEAIISTGKGRAYGLEFSAKIMEMNNMNLAATYTLFRSEFTDSTGVNYYRSAWDTRHQLNLIASYKFGKSWNVAMRWRLVGGAPYSPIDSVSYNRSAWNVTHQAYTDYSKYNSLSLKTSHQLDIRIDKEFYFKKWVLNLYADIQNVYNFKTKSAPVYTNMDPDGNIISDPGGNPDKQGLRTFKTESGTVLPTIGLIIRM